MDRFDFIGMVDALQYGTKGYDVSYILIEGHTIRKIYSTTDDT